MVLCKQRYDVNNLTLLLNVLFFMLFCMHIDLEYNIFGEESQISANQMRENNAFSPLIG